MSRPRLTLIVNNGVPCRGDTSGATQTSWSNQFDLCGHHSSRGDLLGPAAERSGEEVYRQPCPRADGDQKEKNSADRPAPAGAGNQVLTVRGGAYVGRATFGLPKSPAEHHQGDAAGDRRVGGKFDHECGGKKKQSDKAHSCKPFVGHNLGDARGCPAERGFHAQFRSIVGACVKPCVGGGAPTHTIFWDSDRSLSASSKSAGERVQGAAA